MRELEGLSYREIGEKLELTPAAVESTLFRARRKLEHEYAQLDTGRRCQLIGAVSDASRRAWSPTATAGASIATRAAARAAAAARASSAWSRSFRGSPSPRRPPHFCRCRVRPAPLRRRRDGAGAAQHAAAPIGGGGGAHARGRRRRGRERPWRWSPPWRWSAAVGPRSAAWARSIWEATAAPCSRSSATKPVAPKAPARRLKRDGSGRRVPRARTPTVRPWRGPAGRRRRRSRLPRRSPPGASEWSSGLAPGLLTVRLARRPPRPIHRRSRSRSRAAPRIELPNLDPGVSAPSLPRRRTRSRPKTSPRPSGSSSTRRPAGGCG